ncbi:HNH endonuclease signature motif containing protein [Antrihabitans sp. YC2-6]|uniref:HNH endonuclease signature motif containing protein n=1 Tax=Antrihabitans sp. YC2-6 TaxID=2799498 RepID=UPI0018F4FD3F|nr:HNH endonuclease signature motif containing protein [Antrihabitans sp. YC2-6]MBJ8345615.1 DUF222 domain-containing protein [Antrihabitans sp. YC2-6]
MFEKLLQSLSGAGIPDPEVAPTPDMVDAVSDLHRFEAAVCARKHALAAAVYQRCVDQAPADPDPVSAIDPWDTAEAELSAALTITGFGASALIDIGHNLITRLPNVWAAFARGDLDLYRVKIIVNATRNVAEEHLKEVERRILAAAVDGRAALTGRRLRGVVDKVIAQIDLAGLRSRREAATKGRHVWIGPGQDGMAELAGSLPAADAMFVSGRIGEMAKAVCAQDPRTFAARKADALIALTRGQSQLACECGREVCPIGGVSKVGRKALVHVIATHATVTGSSDQPGWLDGFGIVDADQVRDIAKDAIVRPLVDPDEKEATDSYTPSEQVQDYVRALWGSCMFPNCDVPAWECDLDHRDPYNHENPTAGGRTTAENLGPFCRKHHRGKTFGGWDLTKGADGSLSITSPHGKTYPVPETGPIPLLGGTEPDRPMPDTAPDPKQRTRIQQHEARARSERAQNEGDYEPPPF